MFVPIFLILILIFISNLSNISNNLSTFYETSKVTQSTLIEAYKLASETAYKWNKDAKISMVTSTDHGQEVETGLDGKRSTWNFVFGKSGTNNGIAIMINNNKVDKTKTITKKFNEKNIIPINDILLNSNEALKKAISVYSLKQGDNWAIGYHYQLSLINSIPTLTVVGLDNLNYFTKISFNAKTKEIISAFHKIPDGGEIYKNNTVLNIDNNKLISGIGVSISPNNLSDKVIFAYYYKDPYSSKMSLCVSKSQDNGNTWVPIGVSKKLFKNIIFK